MTRITTILGATLAICLCFSEVAQARTITSISPPTGLGLGDVFCAQVQTAVVTPYPNNDNSIAPSPNQITKFPGLSCTPITFKTTDSVDTRVFVEPSGGITEYFFTQTVVNNTSSTWDGFTFQIGFGVNDNFGSPEVILVPPGFAIPNFDFSVSDGDEQPTSSKFGKLDRDGSYSLKWSGGSVAPGESVDFTFSIDIPDDLNGKNLYQSFTIRQVPIARSVPEPTSPSAFLGLLVVMGAGLAFRHKLL
ncbi:PEP-CTERM sorting domain-containing protein [Scytonema sp. UIC 10036]|uniref:PEP-CTERM sorting domain-containing protein n=1 Tax=Scytonema sp. UIC 10036 TaxID=2304196 RepID=UPI0012DA6578|nr:PEP-CTERM sorting domain-containing protein [Scytonema sp. UIC 10036]MUG97164.1 PEP-CTERM sorting domain-containing protein [Scytonema sp. UIC 10036]